MRTKHLFCIIVLIINTIFIIIISTNGKGMYLDKYDMPFKITLMAGAVTFVASSLALIVYILYKALSCIEENWDNKIL